MNAIYLYRVGNFCHRRRIPFIPKLITGFTFLLFNSYIPASATIGRGSRFAYGGMSVVLHGKSVIGEGCLIGQGVTVGAAEAFISDAPKLVPVIGSNVYLAAGSKILGGVRIGDSVVVGANSVVLKDVPSGSVVVGAPARAVGETPSHYKAIA